MLARDSTSPEGCDVQMQAGHRPAEESGGSTLYGRLEAARDGGVPEAGGDGPDRISDAESRATRSPGSMAGVRRDIADGQGGARETEFDG